MTPETVEAEIDSCFWSESCNKDELSGVVKAARARPSVLLKRRTKLQLQCLVLQCKLQECIIDEDVVDITSSLSRELPEFEADSQHQILLRTQAALHDLEENELPMDCFAETVEALFEASDDDSEDFAAALAARKTDLLRFCKTLAELAGTDSSAHSLLMAQTTYSYPKADALAALLEVVEALRAYLQTLGTPQGDAVESPVAGCEQSNARREQPVMHREGLAGPSENTAQSIGGPGAGLEAAAAGDMQQLSMKQSCAHSDVDILNTPTSQSQRAHVTRLGLPSKFPWNEPDTTPVDHGNDPAAGGEAAPQPADGGLPLQPAHLTESQLLVPDSYLSDRPAYEATPKLTGERHAEPQPDAQSHDALHAETQYQDVLQDEEMPEAELSEWQVPNEQAEEEVGMEEDGVRTENQENCSFHSNSQAPAANSQGKKGSQEDHIRGSDSPDRSQIPALHDMPDVAQAEDQEPGMDEGLDAACADAEAHAAGEFQAYMVSVEAHEDPPADAEAVHLPEAEVVADAEEDFQDAQAVPSTDAEADEGSSESDYDSPSWQGSGEDLLFGSEQQDKAAKSQSESQEPVLHHSLGNDSSEQGQRALHLRADMRVQESAQPIEPQGALQEGSFHPDGNSGPTAPPDVAGEGEEATTGDQDNNSAGVPGSMARMTVVTKPDALAQPRRHKAKRRTLTSPKKVTRAAEVDRQAAADDHQGNVEAAEAIADEMGVVDLTEEPAVVPVVNNRVAAAASSVTPDEVVRSFLRVRDSAAAASSPPGGLTDLMGVIQAGLFSSAAAAAAPAAQDAVGPDPSAAAVLSPIGGDRARGTAGAARPSQAAMRGTAAGGDAHGAREDVNGDGQMPAAEPAWRTKGSAAARRDSLVSVDLAKEMRINVSAPPAADRTDGGPSDDSWPSLIAGLSFSAALAAQPSTARDTARKLPLVPEGAMDAKLTGVLPAARQPPPMRKAAAAQLQEASLPAPTSPQGPDQARRPAHAPPQQADRGRGGRMAELHFHASSHGSRASVPAATGTPIAGRRPSNGDLPGRPHQVAQQQRQDCRDRGAVIAEPEVPVISMTVAAPVDNRLQSLPKRPRQQISDVPLEAPSPAAKRQKVQGAVGGGSLWDLANNVMVHMAQRLMPGAPAEQSAPPQAAASEAPVPPDQAASAPFVPPAQAITDTSGFVEQPEDQSCSPPPPPLQTAALRAVVEAAINNPGAVALPTLVPARYQRAHQKAAAAVRAASARANAQRAAAPLVEAPAVRMGVAPPSIGQKQLSTRMAHRPAPASAASRPNARLRAEPVAQLASPRQVEDEEMPPFSQEVGAGMLHGAGQLPEPLAAGSQQPLTQLPSPGYDGAAMPDWPQPAPAPQPLMPSSFERRPPSAQPQCMPTPRHAAVSGRDWRSTPATVGPYPSGEVLSEQRQWPQEAAKSMRGTGRGYLGRDGPPASAAAREWGHREQDALHVQAGAAELQQTFGHSLRSTMPLLPDGAAHNQVQQQQQDFSFQRPQAQRRDYMPQQIDPALLPGPGFSSCARSPWGLAQPAAASGNAQQQTFTAQPFLEQMQGCQQELTDRLLLQAPYIHERQRPAPTMGTGHLLAGGQPGMAVCGDPAQEDPVTMSGTGCSSFRTGGDPTMAAFGRSLPAQQQSMWQHAAPLQQGQVQTSTAWGPASTGTQIMYPPLAACPVPPPQQQPWQYQQMSRPGFAPEQQQGQDAVQYDMARHVNPVQPCVQQAPLQTPTQPPQKYPPRHGAWEWHDGPVA